MSTYKLKAYQSQHDSKFYGELWYGNNVVAQLKEDDLPGFKNFKALEQWARAAALNHKWSVSPADSHHVESSFTV